ncbi:MAG: hypothetical protein BWX83_01070 [Candidatus Cloacimonetes bacterium ADurb.Bin117]|nr:MAG: hypothetical protein BWX83_01070 [Candidatus Cloacimonetes bacterium ADurb.Bin117]
MPGKRFGENAFPLRKNAVPPAAEIDHVFVGDYPADAFGAQIILCFSPVVHAAVAVDPGEQDLGVSGVAEEILVPTAIGHPQGTPAVQSGAGYLFQDQSIRIAVGFPGACPGVIGPRVNCQLACHGEMSRPNGQFAPDAAAAWIIAKTVPGGIHVQGIQMHEIQPIRAADVEIVGGAQLHGLDGVG